MIKKIAGFEIEITKKKIKNMYLSVSHEGKIRVSAPKSMTYSEIEQFVVSKSDWIKEKQAKISESASVHQYQSGETLYIFGEKFTLSVEAGESNTVTCKDNFIILTLKNPQADRLSLLNEWYRRLLKEKISVLLPECEKKTGLYADSWQIKNMKTRWGSCNIRTKKIWLNLQLAKMPEICLEYVILHELAHLAVSNHSAEFKRLLDGFMPDWRSVKNYLNKEYPKMQ